MPWIVGWEHGGEQSIDGIVRTTTSVPDMTKTWLDLEHYRKAFGHSGDAAPN